MRALALRCTCVLLFLPALVSAQDSSARDARGVNVLQGALAAMGATLPRDASATGSFTSYVGGHEQTGTIRIQFLGADRYREAVEIEGSSREFTVAGTRGISKDGERHLRLPLASTLVLPHACAPLAKLSAILANPRAGIRYIGVEKTGAAEVHAVLVTLPPPSNASEPDPPRPATIRLLLDSSSYLPLQMSFDVFSPDAPNDTIPTVITFEDWQPTNGLLFPMKISRSLNGTPHSLIRVQKIELNSNLSESLFAIQ